MDNVFFNLGEFAEPIQLEYDGEAYQITAIIEQDNEENRAQSAADHSEGIYQVDVTAYLKYTELGFKPKRNHDIALDGVQYVIVESMVENGMVILKLLEYDE